VQSLNHEWFGEESIWKDSLCTASVFMLEPAQRCNPLLDTDNPSEASFKVFQYGLCEGRSPK
jgi:hypothetical protein